MLLAMADNPVVLQWQNPVPEIDYHLAKATRTDIILLGDQIIPIK
jgi:malate dehydrogenase (oxaloacetate-decarboxylating)(NADP+)